jgi:hypothetical protein
VGKTSGAALLALQRYFVHEHGDDAFDRVLERLPAELAEALRGIILPVQWYPTEAFVGAIEAAAVIDGRPDFFEIYGTAAAEFEITAFQKVLLRLTSPAFLVQRTGRVWNRFHDTGTWEVEGHGKTMRATLREFAVVSEGYCRVLTAWLRRAGQLTGSKGGNVEHPACRARGDEACLFTGWWT